MRRDSESTKYVLRGSASRYESLRSAGIGLITVIARANLPGCNSLVAPLALDAYILRCAVDTKMWPGVRRIQRIVCYKHTQT